MQNTASDLSARLLATENLSVVRAKASTASFDIKSRVLTLPLWKDMTPEIEDMLIGHEVGHALYTGEAYIAPIIENPKMKSYLNVLEDVRIEKLMKRKYPGIRKRMNEGYKQLNERDFFGVKSIQDFSELLLIDRINLYFKVGFDCGVKFTPEEKVFVNRAERTETLEEIIELAKDIYAYSKEQAEERKRQRQEAGEDIEEGDEDLDDPILGDFDIDIDDEFEEEDSEEQTLKSSKSGSNKENDDNAGDEEEDLGAKTDRVFQERLEELADASTEYVYWKFNDKYFEDPVVSYKTILNETKSVAGWNGDDTNDYRTRYMDEATRKAFFESFTKEYDMFKTDSLRTVNYLVKEFEMKKSAQLYKRAQVSKVGSLDMRKVWAYKLQDDLFKRVTCLPQGKNHGMVMLLDWSGSMDNVLQDTLKQVINLAMFCQRIQVPYRVYAFTTDYQGIQNMSYEERLEVSKKQNAWINSIMESGENYLSNAKGFHLLEFFNNKMTSTEFNEMSKRLLDYRFRWNDGYGTSGTPLNEALAWCYLHLGDFIKKNNIEKTTFITLTDGEGGQLVGINRNGRLDEVKNDYVDGKYVRTKMRHFIKDDVTQKTYELKSNSAVQTEAILRMIKDRHNVNTVGFYICRNHRRDLQSVIAANIPEYNGNSDVLIESWRKQFRDQNFASIKNTGRDELFLIPQAATKIEEGELDVKADAKAASIAKNFSKYLNVKKTSRVLLNRFVSLVA